MKTGIFIVRLGNQLISRLRRADIRGKNQARQSKTWYLASLVEDGGTSHVGGGVRRVVRSSFGILADLHVADADNVANKIDALSTEIAATQVGEEDALVAP